jgi:F0F1-type ATP synthase assembly protein I
MTKPEKTPPSIYSVPITGLSMAVGMGILAWLGVLFDNKFNTKPWGMIVGMFAGLFYCGYEFYKLIKQSQDDQNK